MRIFLFDTTKLVVIAAGLNVLLDTHVTRYFDRDLIRAGVKLREKRGRPESQMPYRHERGVHLKAKSKYSTSVHTRQEDTHGGVPIHGDRTT